MLAKANTELKKIIPYATFQTVKDIKYQLKNLTKNKNHLPHDITGLLTSTGEVNILKIIALYEQEKIKYETNQQKFDELAKYFDVTVQDIKLKEIGKLLGNNENAEEMAEKNKETIEAVIELSLIHI